jgi:hypothetical protein
VTLRKGSARNDPGFNQGIPVHHPHTLVLRNWWNFSTLADLLASPPSDRNKGSTVRFRYCGATEVDGHPCVEIRGDSTGGQFGQGASIVLYLATDRNDIPIKLEYYIGHTSLRLSPTSISRCADFREIAPGVWYPFRLTDVGVNSWWLITQGWVVLSQRRDTTIESVTSPSRVSDAVFRDVIVPAEAQVQLRDEAGSFVSLLQQPEAGVPSLMLKRYLELLSQAQVHPQEQQARGRALDALIGKPAPEFPPNRAGSTASP